MKVKDLEKIRKLVPLADSVVWDEEDGCLSVQTQSVRGPNLNYYDREKCREAVRVALKHLVPVYVRVRKVSTRRGRFTGRVRRVKYYSLERVHRNPVMF